MSFFRYNVNFTLLHVGASEHHANWNWSDVYSPFARLLYVKEGGAFIKLGGTTTALEAGYIYLVPPFALHHSQCDGYYSQIYIHFYESMVSGESLFDNYVFELGHRSNQEIDLLVNKLLRINPDRELPSYDPHRYDNSSILSQNLEQNKTLPLYWTMETKGILLQLVSFFLKNATPVKDQMDRRVAAAIQYIQENVQHNISLQMLANAACVSEDHFIRIFKKDMNCTPLHFVNTKKIEKAQLLLITTNKRVNDIAFDLSIESVSYFNRLFKKYTSKTPSEYRKIHDVI